LTVINGSLANQLSAKKLLSIIELGGYPDFKKLYESQGYEVIVESSMRKAFAVLKKKHIDVVVAEFNYQHTFRDRMSSLESLIATVQKNELTQLIVLFEREYENHFDKLRKRFRFAAEIAFPVDDEKMLQALNQLN
jgi:hypothetical protein